MENRPGESLRPADSRQRSSRQAAPYAPHTPHPSHTPRQPGERPVRRPTSSRQAPSRHEHPRQERPRQEMRPENRPEPRGGRPMPPRRRRRKRNLLPALLMGLVGVVVIALVIMGIKSLVENPGEPEAEETSGLLDDMLNSISQEPTPTPVPTPTPTPAPTPAPERDITGLEVQELDGMVIVGDSAYEYYKFNQELADRYVAALNRAAKNAEVPVTDLVLPTSVDIMLPLSFLEEYAEETSDQEKATAYLFGRMDEEVGKVPLYADLKAHCDEDIYFRTDNHITSLGAYYVYEALARAKGWEPMALADCKKVEYDGFQGNLYSATGNPAISETETIVTYQPRTDLTLRVSIDGSMQQWPLFVDVSDYGAPYKYSTFLAGTFTYAEITNNELSDDSACVLVIDSNGAPLAPYIAAHFAKTYVIDYRSYEGTAADLAAETGADEIIYFTSIVATSSESLCESLSEVAD